MLDIRSSLKKSNCSKNNIARNTFGKDNVKNMLTDYGQITVYCTWVLVEKKHVRNSFSMTHYEKWFVVRCLL